MNSFDSYFNWNNERLNNYKLINLSELVAKRASNQMWGNGYVFNSNKPDIQEWIDYIETNFNLLKFFYQAEKIHSIFGVAVLIAITSDQNIPYIGISLPYGQSRITRIGDKTLAAEVYVRRILSDIDKTLKITYTLDKITFDWYGLDNNTIITGSIRNKLDAKYRLKPEVRNKYDFIPVIFSQNLPKAVLYGSGNLGGAYPDAVSVRNIETMLDKTVDTLFHELEFNKTRGFAQLTNFELKQLQKKDNMNTTIGIRKLFLKDFLIRVKKQSGTTASRSVELLVADPRFESYTTLMDWQINTYFRGCGYSTEDEGTRQETATQTSIKQSDDIETTRIKRNFRQRSYCELLRMLLIMVSGNNAITNSDFTFLIKENNIIDRDKEIERQVILLNEGLTTRERVLKELNGLSDEQTKELLREVEKEKDENDERMFKLQEQSAQLGENNDNDTKQTITEKPISK